MVKITLLLFLNYEQNIKTDFLSNEYNLSQEESTHQQIFYNSNDALQTSQYPIIQQNEGFYNSNDALQTPQFPIIQQNEGIQQFPNEGYLDQKIENYNINQPMNSGSVPNNNGFSFSVNGSMIDNGKFQANFEGLFLDKPFVGNLEASFVQGGFQGNFSARFT